MSDATRPTLLRPTTAPNAVRALVALLVMLMLSWALVPPAVAGGASAMTPVATCAAPSADLARTSVPEQEGAGGDVSAALDAGERTVGERTGDLPALLPAVQDGSRGLATMQPPRIDAVRAPPDPFLGSLQRPPSARAPR